MDGGDSLSAGNIGEFEGIIGDSVRSLLSNDLNTLDNAWVNFVLDTGEFSFSIFSDDNNIDIFMSLVEVGKTLGIDHVGEETQFLVDSG